MRYWPNASLAAAEPGIPLVERDISFLFAELSPFAEPYVTAT